MTPTSQVKLYLEKYGAKMGNWCWQIIAESNSIPFVELEVCGTIQDRQ